jgi:hypothetical protein
MWRTWWSTVLGEIDNRAPTCSLVPPRHISRSTSTSRSVSPAAQTERVRLRRCRAAGGAEGDALRRTGLLHDLGRI